MKNGDPWVTGLCKDGYRAIGPTAKESKSNVDPLEREREGRGEGGVGGG